MVLFADMWLRSAAPLAIALAMAGVLFLGLFAPMYAVDKVLAVEGVRTVATVSKVDTTVYTHGSRSYTVWLTDIDGKPIDRSLASSSRRRVGDKFMVVFDPNGLAPTELPATVVRSWPLPAMLVSALATIVGLVLMARRRREV